MEIPVSGAGDNAGGEASPELRAFCDRLAVDLRRHAFIKLSLGKYRGADVTLKNLLVRPVIIRGQECLSLIYRYQTRDITKNFSAAEGLEVVRTMLGKDFKNAHYFSATETVQLEISKKGRCQIGRTRREGASAADEDHDRGKTRLIDPASPFLFSLGVTDEQGQILPSMTRKWKQINVFLEILDRAVRELNPDPAVPVTVTDFGSGKGYLTFAVYDYLRHKMKLEAAVTGVEVRGELVALCRDAASGLGLEGLRFEEGDVTGRNPEPCEILIALHACDTATDSAIALGIRSNAGIILCSPCCHKEVRPLITIPPVLRPVLRHGVQLGQEAEMVTDTLRALWLEVSGYRATIFEFISPEHTGKNKMILAVKGATPGRAEAAKAELEALKAFYGIKTTALEGMLGG